MMSCACNSCDISRRQFNSHCWESKFPHVWFEGSEWCGHEWDQMSNCEVITSTLYTCTDKTGCFPPTYCHSECQSASACGLQCPTWTKSLLNLQFLNALFCDYTFFSRSLVFTFEWFVVQLDWLLWDLLKVQFICCQATLMLNSKQPLIIFYFAKPKSSVSSVLVLVDGFQDLTCLFFFCFYSRGRRDIALRHFRHVSEVSPISYIKDKYQALTSTIRIKEQGHLSRLITLHQYSCGEKSILDEPIPPPTAASVDHNATQQEQIYLFFYCHLFWEK